MIDTRIKVEKKIEDRETQEETRKYLGLSGIGHPCSRYLWYRFRLWQKPGTITPKQKRLFGRGHREEPIIIDDLKKIGVKIVSVDQDECSAIGDHLKGHLDAILANVPGLKKYKKVLGEFKTSATKYFNLLVKSGSVEKTFFTHYCQMQGYMHLFKIRVCLYICVCKETDERYYEIVEHDSGFAKDLMDKADEIILSDLAPLRLGKSNYYRCGPKWCEMRNLCHFQDLSKAWRTCRSCKHIKVHDKGEWYCEKRKEKRSWEKQFKPCKKYQRLKTD